MDEGLGVTPHIPSGGILKGMRILVVDDDRNTREMLGEILRLHDADVQTAESVTDALNLYQNWHPTQVVSDLGMPVRFAHELDFHEPE